MRCRNGWGGSENLEMMTERPPDAQRQVAIAPALGFRNREIVQRQA